MSNQIEYESQVRPVGDKFFQENKFNIPVYQRMYVWEELQIETLIDDLISAYTNVRKRNYYLGSVVIAKNSDHEDVKYDLIDGQQRFTTLLFLRKLLQSKDELWKLYRLGEEYKKLEQDDSGESEDERRIAVARKILNGRIDVEEKDDKDFRTSFFEYLQKQVYLVVIKIPPQADLNKIFELINDRGVQLLQHQILKAKILEKISDDTERTRYGHLWDACSQVDKFFIKESSKNKIDPSSLYDNNETIEAICSHSDYKREEDTPPKNDDEHDEVDDGDYQSIVSFPTFLLYVLAIYKGSSGDFLDGDAFNINGARVEYKENNLIAIFNKVLLKDDEKNIELECIRFIDLLSKCRLAFDEWVIRKCRSNNVESGYEHKRYTLKNEKSEKNKKSEWRLESLERREEDKAISLLQSMLYHSHSPTTQEWLIPFLRLMIDGNIADSKEVLEHLRCIDNSLYSTVDENNKANGTVLTRAIAAMNPNASAGSAQAENIVKYLGNEYGTGFAHYWFYKMDWIIWWYYYYLKDRVLPGEIDKDKEITNFRFTSRTSVEHVTPQSHEKIDKFGNLALVSPSTNSELSNNLFEAKKESFKKPERRNNLKLSLIFSNKKWDKKDRVEHEEHCFELIKKYFDSDV